MFQCILRAFTHRSPVIHLSVTRLHALVCTYVLFGVLTPPPVFYSHMHAFVYKGNSATLPKLTIQTIIHIGRKDKMLTQYVKIKLLLF